MIKKKPFNDLMQNEKFKSLKAQYGHLGFCFLIPFIISLCIYFALGHKPIGDNSVLVLDLNAQYVYFYEALRDAIYGDTSLLYSFSRSLGGEFVGIYAYYIASPLSYIVALFPKEHILYALLLIIAIKLGLCGASFGFFLQSITKSPKKDNILIFSIMYALCSYAIVYQNNIMWLDALYLLPLLAFSVERLIKSGKYLLYAGTLALIMITHYYIGYMLCWFTAFYFFFAYFKDSDRSLINPRGESRHFLRSITRMGASTLLGIGIAAFMIVGAYYSLGFGKNDFSEPNWDIVARFDFFDLFPKLLPGSYDTVMHEGLPLLYSGVLTLFMLPIFFMAKRVPPREKVFYGAFVLLYVLIMMINPTDLVMHGFQEPNCLNYRYSFVVIFLMLIMAYKGFCELEEHSSRAILGTGGALFVLVCIAQKMEFPNFVLQDREGYEYGYVLNKLPFFQVVVFSVIAIFIIGAVLCYLMRSKNKEKVKSVLLCVICLELFINGIVQTVSLGYNVGFSTYSSYADYLAELRPIVDTVQNEDKGFYRMEKTTHRATNDNMALGMKGLSNSTSTLNAKVIDLLEYLGYYADAHWTQYLGSTVVTDSLFGVKYVVSNRENEFNKESLALNELMDVYYEKVASDTYYNAYKNPYALSLAYGVDSGVKELEFDTQYDYSDNVGLKNPFEVQNLLLNALVGNGEEDAVEFYTPIELRKNINITGASNTIGGGLEYAATSNGYDDKYVHFTFTVEKAGPLYLFLPSGYERSFTVFIGDEQYVTSYNYSRIIYLGYREADEEMEVSFRLDQDNLYFFKNTNYLYTLDMDAFEEAYEKLASTNLSISEESTDDHILGSIVTSEANKTIMTTIPYDSGWKVYVDGKEIETYALLDETLMAFNIESIGEHSVEMKYMPDIYLIGTAISVVSILVFIAISIFTILKIKKERVAALSQKSEPTEEAVSSDIEAPAFQMTENESTDTDEKTEGED